jgi:hypothetical protein
MREDDRLLQHKRIEEFAVAKGSSWKIQKVSVKTYGALKRVKRVERWKIKRNNELRKGKGAVANGETSHTRVRQIQCRTHVVLGGFLGWCVCGEGRGQKVKTSEKLTRGGHRRVYGPKTKECGEGWKRGGILVEPILFLHAALKPLRDNLIHELPDWVISALALMT